MDAITEVDAVDKNSTMGFLQSVFAPPKIILQVVRSQDAMNHKWSVQNSSCVELANGIAPDAKTAEIESRRWVITYFEDSLEKLRAVQQELDTIP